MLHELYVKIIAKNAVGGQFLYNGSNDFPSINSLASLSFFICVLKCYEAIYIRKSQKQ